MLDAVEHVVAAAVWVFDQIKTGIEKLIQFLEFLFEWQDILITHNVIKNVFTKWVDQSIDSLSNAETGIISAFQDLQGDIATWANIKSFPPVFDQPSGNSPFGGAEHGAPANLGTHHYQGNAAGASALITHDSVTEDVFKDFLEALNAEETTLSNARTAIQTEILDQFSSLSITEMMQKFVAIVVKMELQTLENVLVAAVKVLVTLASGLKGLMNEAIDIPVLSWLYYEITGDPLSFLDLICLVAAIPATILYKIVEKKAPFPENDPLTNHLKNAQSFDDVRSAFFKTSNTSEAALLRRSPALTEENSSVPDQDALNTLAFVTGIMAFAGGVVMIATTAYTRVVEADNESVPIPKTLALVNAIANVAYVSPNLSGFVTANDFSSGLNNILTIISIGKGFINIPLSAMANSPITQGFAVIETVSNIVWNIPVIVTAANFDGSDPTAKTVIALETLGNFSFNVGGMLEFPIFETTDLRAKAIESAVQFYLMLTYGEYMLAAGALSRFASAESASA